MSIRSDGRFPVGTQMVLTWVALTSIFMASCGASSKSIGATSRLEKPVMKVQMADMFWTGDSVAGADVFVGDALVAEVESCQEFLHVEVVLHRELFAPKKFGKALGMEGQIYVVSLASQEDSIPYQLGYVASTSNLMKRLAEAGTKRFSGEDASALGLALGIGPRIEHIRFEERFAEGSETSYNFEYISRTETFYANMRGTLTVDSSSGHLKTLVAEGPATQMLAGDESVAGTRYFRLDLSPNSKTAHTQVTKSRRASWLEALPVLKARLPHGTLELKCGDDVVPNKVISGFSPNFDPRRAFTFDGRDDVQLLHTILGNFRFAVDDVVYIQNWDVYGDLGPFAVRGGDLDEFARTYVQQVDPEGLVSYQHDFIMWSRDSTVVLVVHHDGVMWTIRGGRLS